PAPGGGARPRGPQPCPAPRNHSIASRAGLGAPLVCRRADSDAGRMVGSRGLSLRRADAGSPAGRAWLGGRRIELPQERGATSHRAAHRATSIRRGHHVALQPGPAPLSGASRVERNRARRSGDPLNAACRVAPRRHRAGFTPTYSLRSPPRTRCPTSPKPPARKTPKIVSGGTHSAIDRKSTRLNSSHEWSSYAVFCLKKTTSPAETMKFLGRPGQT